MKLGDWVKFETDYVKTGNNFDPEWIEDTAPQEVIDDMFENGYELIKMKPRFHDEPKFGIIVGKRKYAIETKFEYMQYADQGFGNPPDAWESIAQPQETFYLVACNLNGFHKVREGAVQLIEMIEDPVEGLDG